MHMPNKRIKFAHCVRPTHNGEAPLLVVYARPVRLSDEGVFEKGLMG